MYPRVSKLCSGQCTPFSLLRPEFNPCDRQWVYVIGYGGRPHGHMGFFWLHIHCFLELLKEYIL